MNKIYEGNIEDGFLIPHELPGGIYYKGEPMDMIRLEGKLQHYKNALGTRKVVLNIGNGNYTVYEKEAEDV